MVTFIIATSSFLYNINLSKENRLSYAKSAVSNRLNFFQGAIEQLLIANKTGIIKQLVSSISAEDRPG